MKAVGVFTEVCVSPPIVTGEHRTWCLQQIWFIFLVSWHGWLVLCLPCQFLADGLEHCHATAPGAFLTQGIDIQNTDF